MGALQKKSKYDQFKLFEHFSDLKGVMDYEELRRLMVETQLIPRGIKDKRVLNAMLKVPRHLFVDESVRHKAYDDMALPIGDGQTISQPYMVAIMTEIGRAHV